MGFIVDNTNDITGKLTCTVVNKKRTDKVHHTLALPEEGLSGSNYLLMKFIPNIANHSMSLFLNGY